MNTAPATSTHTLKGDHMPSTITITTIGSDAERAAAKVAKRLPAGISLTGRASLAYQGRMVALEATVADTCDRDDAWVVLTSYGMSPSDDLGASWQSVPGVGC